MKASGRRRTRDFHSRSQIPIQFTVWERGCNGCVTTAGLNVSMAEKMTAGEYEAYLYSVLSCHEVVGHSRKQTRIRVRD